MEDLETITINFEDGESGEFYVLEQTQLMGNHYYLVMSAEDNELSVDGDDDTEEEWECFILKENGDESDEEYGMYSFVEDEAEIESLSKIFDELMDDSDVNVKG